MDVTENQTSGHEQLKKLFRNVIYLESIEKKTTYLRVYESLSLQQIAKISGLSERSVKIILENVVTKIKGTKEIKGGY